MHALLGFVILGLVVLSRSLMGPFCSAPLKHGSSLSLSLAIEEKKSKKNEKLLVVGGIQVA
jgi:hypothetical protein